MFGAVYILDYQLWSNNEQLVDKMLALLNKDITMQ